MIIIGIDPGLSGAIAILKNDKVIKLIEMPVMAEGKKNKRQLNNAQLANILREIIKNHEEISVVVEQVNAMPGQGVTSITDCPSVKDLVKNLKSEFINSVKKQSELLENF